MEPVILFKILAVLTTSVFLSNFLRQKIKLPNQLESKRAKTLTSLLQSAVSITIFVVGFFLVLSILGIDIKPLLASAGIIGIAIGFGSQTLVKDLINGLCPEHKTKPIFIEEENYFFRLSKYQK